MNSHSSNFQARLFYSYSNKDAAHRDAMEQSLSLLEQQSFISGWHDEKILPGRSISDAIHTELDTADIVIFLISQNFIASKECINEWKRAKIIASNNPCIFRIPVVLDDCAWLDLLDGDDIKALPNDGTPVTNISPPSTAWQQVYEGIKEVVFELRQTFEPKHNFVASIERTEFLSTHEISLSSIFVFPRLSTVRSFADDGRLIEDTIDSQQQLLDRKRLLIHGQEMSGKTALARFLFLNLLERGEAVLLVDSLQTRKNTSDKVLQEAYCQAFSGDYDIWINQPTKTLILDNFSSDPGAIKFLMSVGETFERIVVLASTDIFAGAQHGPVVLL